VAGVRYLVVHEDPYQEQEHLIVEADGDLSRDVIRRALNLHRVILFEELDDD
jgi:hypothetical protein